LETERMRGVRRVVFVEVEVDVDVAVVDILQYRAVF
jgi:hypothetical protein